MKTKEVIAKAKDNNGKEVEIGRGTYTAFESNQELILYLQNAKVSAALKDRIRTDINRQRKTDVRNKLAQEGKPVSNKTLIVRGLKSGQIPASEAAALIKKFKL